MSFTSLSNQFRRDWTVCGPRSLASGDGRFFESPGVQTTSTMPPSRSPVSSDAHPRGARHQPESMTTIAHVPCIISSHEQTDTTTPMQAKVPTVMVTSKFPTASLTNIETTTITCPTRRRLPSRSQYRSHWHTESVRWCMPPQVQTVIFDHLPGHDGDRPRIAQPPNHAFPTAEAAYWARG